MFLKRASRNWMTTASGVRKSESAGCLNWFELQLLQHLRDQSLELAAWVCCQIITMYSSKIPDIKKFTKVQGQLYGRIFLEFNREDNKLVVRFAIAAPREVTCAYASLTTSESNFA